MHFLRRFVPPDDGHNRALPPQSALERSPQSARSPRPSTRDPSPDVRSRSLAAFVFPPPDGLTWLIIQQLPRVSIWRPLRFPQDSPKLRGATCGEPQDLGATTGGPPDAYRSAPNDSGGRPADRSRRNDRPRGSGRSSPSVSWLASAPSRRSLLPGRRPRPGRQPHRSQRQPRRSRRRPPRCRPERRRCRHLAGSRDRPGCRRCR